MAKQPSSTTEIDALRKENARLEAEVARLTHRLTTEPEHPNASKHRSTGGLIRKTVVVVCMVFAVILLVLGNLFFWAGNTLVDQDRFVAATAPVIQDHQVQQTLSLYTTNQIFSAVNVQQFIASVLPPRAAFLAPQLASQVRSHTQSSLQQVLAAPRFQQVWNTVIARQHQRIIQFAKTYQGNGTISLNDIFQQLTSNLGNTKLSFLSGKQLPQSVGSITVINASWLPLLHNLVKNIGLWRTLSILGLIIFTALAIWLSKHRRRTIYLLSLFAVLGMAISLIILRVAREHIIDKVRPDYAGGVARAIQIITHGLLVQTVTIMIAILILGFIAWISGGSSSSMATKRFTRELFTEKLHGVLFGQENAFTTWVGSKRLLLAWGAVAIFIVIMLSVRLTFKTLLVLVILLLIVEFVIEIIANQARRMSDQKT